MRTERNRKSWPFFGVPDHPRTLRLHHEMRHILYDGIVLKSLGTALTAVATFLNAPKRSFSNRSDKIVDREIAGLDAVSEAIHIARRMCEGIGSQRIRKRIGLLNSLVERFDGIDQG